MSSPSASVFFVISLMSVFLLAACGETDIKLPKVFGDSEVPSEVLNAPRVVPAPPQATEARTWPRLGDVPSRPKDFTPQATIDAAKAEMESDRADAQQRQQEYQAAPPVVPSWGAP